MSPTHDIPTGLRRLLTDEGAEVAASRPIDHGTQYDLVRNGESVKLNVYRTGKVSTGGKASRLMEVLEGWRTGEGRAGRGGSRAPAGSRPALDGTPRLGIDEAGKGDYFGPLVVAGVRVAGEEMAAELREIGVRDSKTVGVLGARPLAERILGAVGPENVRVVVLGPEEYEARRRAAGNVNDLLGEVDAGIIHELQDEVELIVVDQYAKGARARLASSVPSGVRLEVRPRAEDDAAVAAASILARARQLDEVDRLSETVGFLLPLGATHVLDAGRRVVRERGRRELD
ncbi:MAG TPA: hypothetical protein VGV91_12045, partial [Rubrobacter sp.]|nr:hypothetical protein [Rubrobacter sp.]